MNLSRVTEKLNRFAPLQFAESWDNVGLLIEPSKSKPIARMLLTNDLTSRVLSEALQLNVQMIVSYHPPLFQVSIAGSVSVVVGIVLVMCSICRR